MEPFRPVVDITVFDLHEEGATQLDSETKSRLAGVLNIDYQTENGRTPLSHLLVRISRSLARVYQKTQTGLEMPLSMRPVALQVQEEK